MPAALGVVALQSPGVLTAAFNPVALNVAVAALALAGWLLCRDLPTADRCRYQRPAEEA
jgi:hypothetical protein